MPTPAPATMKTYQSSRIAAPPYRRRIRQPLHGRSPTQNSGCRSVGSRVGSSMATSADGSARPLATVARSRASARLRRRALSLVGADVFRIALRRVLRAARQPRAWPPREAHLDVAEGAFGTLLLFAASAVMVASTRAMDRGRFRAARLWTASAIVAALGFVASRCMVTPVTASRSPPTPTARSTTR